VLKDSYEDAEELRMGWWQFLFTAMFGLPLAALGAVLVAERVMSVRSRLMQPSAEGHRRAPSGRRGQAGQGAPRVAAMRRAAGAEPSRKFLVRSLSVGGTEPARTEVDVLRPPDLS
jgi:hypothetical protein